MVLQIGRRKKVVRIVGMAVLILTVFPLAAPVRALDFANPAFQRLWNQTDNDTSQAPVWGLFATGEVDESYVEAAGGQRAVQYFDKGRMELANATTGQVSAGLLATELITATLQTGDSASKAAKPANVPIAGDPDNTFPTYASLGVLRTAPSGGSTGPATRLYNPDGSFGVRQEASSDPAAAYAATENLTNHTIPRAFADFRNDPRHPLATIGLAITEPVWARVKVGGVLKDVMIQAFERRVLTYTPANPDPFKVEFGNIGQHYYRWRYSPDGGGETPRSGGTSGPTTTVAGVLPIFQAAYNSQYNPGLGNPTTPNASTNFTYSIVIMQHGIMLYVQPQKKIYALPSDGMGAVFDDPYKDSSPPQDDCTKPGPTAGTFVPCRGFGKVWNDNPAVRLSLGYALAPERGVLGQTQFFENGFIFYDQERNRSWMANTMQFVARYWPVT